MTENKAAFFARLEPRLAPSDMARVRGAYYLAKYGHRAQVRKELGEDGKPLRYFEHVRRVALVLMDEAKVFDPDAVITALLHDALEDTDDIDAKVIEQFFGATVARRVRLLTKDPKEGYAERLWDADWGTIAVKFCDRLDNLRSLDGCGEDFKAKQVKDTRVHYLSLFEQRMSSNPAMGTFVDVFGGLGGYDD